MSATQFAISARERLPQSDMAQFSPIPDSFSIFSHHTSSTASYNLLVSRGESVALKLGLDTKFGFMVEISYNGWLLEFVRPIGYLTIRLFFVARRSATSPQAKGLIDDSLSPARCMV